MGEVVIIASPTSPLRRSPRLGVVTSSTDDPSGEQRADAVLSPLRLENEVRSPVRNVFSPGARSPAGRPPPIPKSALRTKRQLRSRTGNIPQNSTSQPSSLGFNGHSTLRADDRQSKPWGNIGWLLVVATSFLFAMYAVQLDVNNTSMTSEDNEPMLMVKRASESIQADIVSYSYRVKKAKEVQEKHRLDLIELRDEFDQFIINLNEAESLVENLLGAEGPDDAAVTATRVLKAQSDLQEVQMAAVSSLSEVNTKIETQRSIITAKGLELHDLAIQLQALGANTFGPRLNILEKEANYLIEFLAMNQESINLLTSVVTDSATQSQIDDFVSELRSGATAMRDDDAHLMLPKEDDILKALRGNVTLAVMEENAKEEEEVECMNIETADQLIREAIVRLKGGGQKDFARRSTGGKVVHLKDFTSPTYYPEKNGFPIRMLRWIGADTWVGKQEEALSGDMRLGSCWAMEGQKGRLTVQLSEPIRIMAVTIEHVSARMTPDLSSAPKEFLVYGIEASSITSGNYPEHPQLLLRGTYDVGGPTVQTYQAELHSTIYGGVSIHILSNHGHNDYTCLYSFRVHGISSPDVELERHS